MRARARLRHALHLALDIARSSARRARRRAKRFARRRDRLRHVAAGVTRFGRIELGFEAGDLVAQQQAALLQPAQPGRRAGSSTGRSIRSSRSACSMRSSISGARANAGCRPLLRDVAETNAGRSYSFRP
jgi:hypothetical protein